MSTEQLEDTLERTIALDVATMSPAMRNRYRAALAQAEQPLGYIREPGLRSLAEGNHTTMYPKQIPAHGYTIPVYAHPPAKREAGETAPPESHVVPTIELLADLIDDAAPGILRPDTRLQIASRLRAALATTEGSAE